MALEQSLAALSLATVLSESAVPTKTLVFKPKTAKTATPVPVVVFALQSTQTPSPVIAKAAGVKEPRLAKDDLVTEFFSVSAKEVSIANLHKDLAGKIKLVVDENITKASEDTVLELSTASAKASISAKNLNEYIASTGIEVVSVDFSAEPAAAPAGDTSRKDALKKEKQAAKLEDAKLIGITVDKAKDFSSWYSEIVTKGEMLDYYDVSGCYILRPNSFSVWETIQEWFNSRIKKMGVQNSYFPMFVSSRVLEKEKDHIEGFAPEVAWVTRAGNSELDGTLYVGTSSTDRVYINGASLDIQGNSQSGGQVTNTLKVNGEKQYIDRYGVFKRNRATVTENVTVTSNDRCMSAGPIEINNGVTVTISNGGAWAVV